MEVDDARDVVELRWRGHRTRLGGRRVAPPGRTPRSLLSVVHQDLCFGCGRANLFGLQIELEPAPEGVSGRFFVKQDHQGPTGAAHAGVIGAALEEAMALAIHAEGIPAVTGALRLELSAPAPVGTFVALTARIVARDGHRLEVASEATGDGGEPLAAATATFVRPDGDSV